VGAISYNGSAIAGEQPIGNTTTFSAFRWAYGLAGTGQAPVAVGAAIKGSDDNGATFHAFKWTPAGGLQDLGVTTGTQSTATAISANGLVVVGYATDPSNFYRALR
jgi:uncharacterized membrane protein